MKKIKINQNYKYLTTKVNIPNVDSPIAELLIPTNRVYLMQNKTPLVLKLYNSSNDEIPSPSEVYLTWQSPFSKSIYQIRKNDEL